MKLNEDVKSALKNGYFEGDMFYLTGTLERKTYVSTNDVIEALGGKWSRKDKAHIFEGDHDDLEVALSMVIESGEVESVKDLIKKFQFFPTPKPVADYAVKLADIREGLSVLEPSAGVGHILDSILEDAGTGVVITAVEFDTKNVSSLKAKYPTVNVVEKDFLDYSERKFDRIVMNPPFSKGQDAKHVIHAYGLLNEGGTLVAILPSSVMNKDSAPYSSLRSLNPEFRKLPIGSFKDSGTMVNTVIAIIRK